jgi:sec-independent protein translocase protein TatB
MSEMMVIGVVALVVIGPERLPKVAKTLGHLVGRMQRYVADVKADINREVEMSELKDLKKTMDDAASTMNTAMSAHVNEISDEIRKTEQEFSRLSNPMLHFGLAASAVSAPVNQPSASDTEDLEAPSQMELGLGDAAPENAPSSSPANRT